jgi:hypothetical protein
MAVSVVVARLTSGVADSCSPPQQRFTLSFLWTQDSAEPKIWMGQLEGEAARREEVNHLRQQQVRASASLIPWECLHCVLSHACGWGWIACILGRLGCD